MKVKDLTTKESEVLIAFWSYGDEGRQTMTVREMVVCHAELQLDFDDWDWHDYTPTTLGNILRLLEARSLVISDGENPAAWSVTPLGQRYMQALGDDDAKRRVLQEGYERYLRAIEDTHQHSDVRCSA